MYQRILVPIDGSETATRGLGEAIKLAENQGASIRLVHIVDEMILLSADASGANIASVLEMLRTGGEALLAAAEADVRRAGVEVDAKLIEAMGEPAGGYIVQQATDWPADLIVCGPHGRRGIRRIVMGSDAEFIIRHTPVPVLVLRSHEPSSE